MYAKGQIVNATVEKVYSFGAYVRLPDGQRAYIRCRELTLAGDALATAIVQQGDTVEAKVTAVASRDQMIEVSLRQMLPDPWIGYTRATSLGSVVTCSVRNVSATRIIVEVEPGVLGRIPIAELRLPPNTRPDQVFWPGDRVQAVVIHLDPTRKRMDLSIRRRSRQLARAEEIAQKLNSTAIEPDIGDRSDQGTVNPEPDEAYDTLASVDLQGAILIVEDRVEVREPLLRFLRDRGGVVHGAVSGRDALMSPWLGDSVLALVDLDMPDLNGVDFIRELRSAGCEIPVAVMSDPMLISKHAADLRELDVAEILMKPVDLHQLMAFLSRASRHDISPIQWDEHKVPESTEERIFMHLGREMRSARPLVERLEEGLSYLVRQTKAESGVVFRMNLDTRAVSIVAQVGSVPSNADEIHILGASSVKDVIAGEYSMVENAAREHRAKYRNLHRFIEFQSCVAVPFSSGGVTEHAVFVFHRAAEAFSRYRLRDVAAMATLFSTAVEAQILAKRVESMSGTMLSGELTLAFSHEVNNRLLGLELQFYNLRSQFDRFRSEYSSTDSKGFEALQDSFDLAIGASTGLREWVSDFHELVTSEGAVALIDVNQVLIAARDRVGVVARHAKMQIRLGLSDQSLFVVGNTTGLQQVFINIMLNAIQHIVIKGLDNRILTVETRTSLQEDREVVEVRFSDTGPGIHWQLWQEILELGFTTRKGGSGLGLYIARSLLRSIDGDVCVEESLITQGTTFLITLPRRQASD